MNVSRFACLLALACAGSCVSAQTTNSTGVAKRAPVSLSNDASPTEPVTVAGKSSNAIPFSVVPIPSVSGISPTSGPVGTLVTISGQNLLDAEGHGLASLNGKYIPIVSQSNTAIQVNVPAGGTIAQFHIVVNNTVVRTPLFTVTP